MHIFRHWLFLRGLDFNFQLLLGFQGVVRFVWGHEGFPVGALGVRMGELELCHLAFLLVGFYSHHRLLDMSRLVCQLRWRLPLKFRLVSIRRIPPVHFLKHFDSLPTQNLSLARKTESGPVGRTHRGRWDQLRLGATHACPVPETSLPLGLSRLVRGLLLLLGLRLHIWLTVRVALGKLLVGLYLNEHIFWRLS